MNETKSGLGRQAYCLSTDGQLCWAYTNNISQLYKCDLYTMTDEPVDSVFLRWARSMDL